MKYQLLEDKDWGMRWARPPIKQAMPVDEIYVHQTAGRDPTDLATIDAGEAFRALNEYAINTKGYSAVDYSMLVHTDAKLTTTIGEARGQWMPAATLDRNSISKAVCLFGWFGPPDPNIDWTRTSSREPLDQELEAIAEAIVWMVGQGWVKPEAVIRGHRDNPAHPNATACPGDFLNAKLWIVRALVTKMLLPAPTPTPPTGDDMANIIVDYRPKTAAGVEYSGGSFSLDGIPLSGEMVQVLELQGWKHVKTDHTYWRAAVAHRNGAQAERMYVEFEDQQDKVND